MNAAHIVHIGVDAVTLVVSGSLDEAASEEVGARLHALAAAGYIRIHLHVDPAVDPTSTLGLDIEQLSEQLRAKGGFVRLIAPTASPRPDNAA
jgi:hypothetical protein